jgi:rhamnulokinase
VWARVHNYTNEAGALGGIRFLRNVTGFWLLEQCRRRWGDPAIGPLLAAADRIGRPVPVVDVDDDRLRAPDDMVAEYTSLAGLSSNADPALITRSIIESIAARASDVIAELAWVSSFDDVVVFGGAARMGLFVRRLSELTELTVRVGSAEGAALGNAIVQGVALGVFESLDQGLERIAS